MTNKSSHFTKLSSIDLEQMTYFFLKVGYSHYGSCEDSEVFILSESFFSLVVGRRYKPVLKSGKLSMKETGFVWSRSSGLFELAQIHLQLSLIPQIEYNSNNSSKDIKSRLIILLLLLRTLNLFNVLSLNSHSPTRTTTWILTWERTSTFGLRWSTFRSQVRIRKHFIKFNHLLLTVISFLVELIDFTSIKFIRSISHRALRSEIGSRLSSSGVFWNIIPNLFQFISFINDL